MKQVFWKKALFTIALSYLSWFVLYHNLGGLETIAATTLAFLSFVPVSLFVLLNNWVNEKELVSVSILIIFSISILVIFTNVIGIGQGYGKKLDVMDELLFWLIIFGSITLCASNKKKFKNIQFKDFFNAAIPFVLLLIYDIFVMFIIGFWGGPW